MEISISPSKPEVAIFSVGIRFLRTSVAFFEAHTPTSNTQLENNPQIASADNIGYERPAIEAKTGCKVSGHVIADHFADVGKMVDWAQGADVKSKI